MKRIIVCIVMSMGCLLYGPAEEDTLGIQEMERLMKHAAFFIALPNCSIDQKNKKHKRALIKYSENTNKFEISKNALRNKIYQKSSIRDFIRELHVFLKKNTDKYEVGNHVYKKISGGRIIGIKQ